MPENIDIVLLLNTAVDRQIPIPYYYQLKEYLMHLIHNDFLKPGDRLPTEMEICTGSGLSRTVVRQAIQELENEGVFERFRVKGTFVARPKVREHLVQALTGFYEDTVSRGQVPVTKVLNFEVVPANSKIAHELQIPAGEPVFYLNRLRFIEHEPIVLVATYIPQSLCPGLLQRDFTAQSLYKVLENEYGLVIARAHRSVEAVTASSDVGKLLKVETHSPLLLLKSTGYLEDRRPLEYYKALHRGDRAKFEVDLVRPSSFES